MGSPSAPLCTPRAVPHPPRCCCFPPVPLRGGQKGAVGRKKRHPQTQAAPAGLALAARDPRNGSPKHRSPPSTFSERGLMGIPGGFPTPLVCSPRPSRPGLWLRRGRCWGWVGGAPGQGSFGGSSALPSRNLAAHPLPSATSNGRNWALPLPVPYWEDWTGTAAGARGLLGAGPRSPKAPPKASQLVLLPLRGETRPWHSSWSPPWDGQ